MSYVPAHLRRSFETHEFKQVVDESKVRIYIMRRPGSGIFRVQLTFTGEGIAIQGDTTFGPHHVHGLVSAIGYDEHWFATYPRLSETYLCEKFLTKEFVPAVAADEMEAMLKERDDDPDDDLGLADEMVEEWKGLILALRNSTITTGETLHNDIEQLGYVAVEGFGWDYNPNAAASLCVVQQTFARLAIQKAPPPVEVAP